MTVWFEAGKAGALTNLSDDPYASPDGTLSEKTNMLTITNGMVTRSSVSHAVSVCECGEDELKS